MRQRAFILIVAALIAAPSAAATWYSKGSAEPDTTFDVDGGWMRADRDVTPTSANGQVTQNLVYFNAFMAEYVGYAVGSRTLVSPNVAGDAVSVRSGIYGYPTTLYAILGAWKDCNNDGYVGIGEQGVWEYRAEVLNALPGGASICKPGAVPPTYGAPNAGQTVKNSPWPHNDGTWVREFIPIGWDDGAVSPAGTPGTVDFNPLNINDSESRVWGDWGLPGDPPGGTCYVRPHPRGTFASVGGITDYADCFASGRIQSTLVATPAPVYSQYQALRPLGWGAENGGSQAYVWDCSQPVGPNVYHKISDSSEVDIQLHMPKAPQAGSGSLAGTANHTGAGVTTKCTPHGGVDLNPGQQLAHAPYTTEADVVNTPQARNQPDHEFYYSEGHRPADPIAAFRAIDKTMSGDPTMTGATAGAFDGVWQGNAVTAASRNPFFTRNSGNFEPQPVSYTTIYAHVSPAAASTYHLITPKGTSAQYGSEACPTIAIGQPVNAASNWQCDPMQWWIDANGDRRVDQYPGYISAKSAPEVGSTVGDPYEFRDIDCYDMSVDGARNNGVQEVSWGVLTGTSCSFA